MVVVVPLPEFDGRAKTTFRKEMGSIEKDRLCQQLKKDVRGGRDTWVRVNEISESNVPILVCQFPVGWVTLL